MKEKGIISFELFERLDLRIGQVTSACRISGAKNLILLEIDFGNEKRQVVVGMAQFYEPEYFIGKRLPVLLNLEPRNFMGYKSEGMVLATDEDGRPVLLLPEKEVKPGSIIR